MQDNDFGQLPVMDIEDIDAFFDDGVRVAAAVELFGPGAPVVRVTFNEGKARELQYQVMLSATVAADLVDAIVEAANSL